MRIIWCLTFICWVSVSRAQTPLNVQHTVQKGETLYKISRDYGMTVAEIRELNPSVSVIQPGLKLNVRKKLDIKPRKVAFIEHTVKKGETLYQISQKYQVKVSEIRDLNDLTDNAISAGMLLKIPGNFDVNVPVEVTEKASNENKPADNSDAISKPTVKPAENNEIKGGIIEKSTGSTKTVYQSRTETKKIQLLDTATMPGLDPSKSYIWAVGLTTNQVVCLVNPETNLMTYALAQPKIAQQNKEVIILSPLVAQKLGIQNTLSDVTIQYVVPKP